MGLIRLILASLVIIGHAPEQIDGDRHREPIATLFPTLSLGGIAVDGFFVLSGFLICNSMMRSASAGQYLVRRSMRIYPAFIVAYLACFFVLGPIAGGTVAGLGKSLLYMVTLHSPPAVPGAFNGLPYPAVNGSMWTIVYEFRCYLLVLALGMLGLLGRPKFILALTAVLLIATSVASVPVVTGSLDRLDQRLHLEFFVGSIDQDIRLTAVFMVGVSVQLYWNWVQAHLHGWFAALCLPVLLTSMRSSLLAEVSLATFGAYALFWLAFKAHLGLLQKVNDRWDISYGVYLYGWPVAMAILWFNRQIAPLELAVSALFVTLCFGAASWWGIEKWTKDLGKSDRHAPGS